MKSKQATLSVLLDTSFLLPSFGIDVGEEVSEGLKKLAEVEAEIYYSHFSILESLWVAARLSMNAMFDAERFNLGLRSVVEGDRYVKVEEDSKTFSDALKLHALGHKDIIDNILYASSTRLNIKLLTLDNKLRNFVRENRLTNTLIAPDELMSS